VEVHDQVFTDGELTEDTLDWFAQDKDGNVWYFGEDSDELVNSRVSSLGGPGKAE
jgi:sugar lactone lactonase YvrE